MSTDRRKRSSFVRGRKSRGFTEAGNPLSILLDGLSENEKQMVLCMESSLLKLSQEFPDLEGFDQFTVQVLGQAKDKLRDITAKQTSAWPDPINEETECQLKILPEYIARLKAEQETWDSMLATLELKAETAKNLAEKVDDNPIVDDNSLEISAFDRKLLEAKLDYALLGAEVHREHENFTLNMKTLLGCISKVDMTNVTGLLKEQTQDLYRQSSFPAEEYDARLLF